MNKIVTLSRLMCLTTALAGLALMATPDIANAKRFGQQGGSSHVRQGNSHPVNITKRNGIRPRFVISSQNADAKRVLSHRKEKSRVADCKTNCYKPTQTATKGNLTQPTAASNMTPTVNITRASAVLSDPRKRPQNGAKERILTAVSGGTALKAAIVVPAAVGLFAQPLTTGVLHGAGAIVYKDPIRGPVNATKEYVEGAAFMIESWF